MLVRRHSNVLNRRAVQNVLSRGVPHDSVSGQLSPCPLYRAATRTRLSSTFSSSGLDRPVQTYVSTSQDPYENLAFENHLLTRSPVDSKILFFYINKSCVVIGRNQNPWVECNLAALRPWSHARSQLTGSPQGQSQDDEILLVRRRSGGGTVFHDQGNLNYSIIEPNSNSFARRNAPQLIVAALKASRWGNRNIWVNDRNDIVLQDPGSTGPLKISGSAYKLTRGRALSHGTLLFGSPNLKNISPLLRSLGKSYLKAKGVESVRSPVGSLEDENMTAETRTRTASTLINAIGRYWFSRTASSPEATFSPTHVSSQDFQHDGLATGIEELKSDMWRFEQTPRFTVDTEMIDGVALRFEVNRGVIQEVEVVSRNHDDKSTYLGQAFNEITKGRKVHQISDWKALFTETTVPARLVSRLAMIFPSVSSLSAAKSPSKPGAKAQEIETPGTNMVKDIHIA